MTTFGGPDDDIRPATAKWRAEKYRAELAAAEGARRLAALSEDPRSAEVTYDGLLGVKLPFDSAYFYRKLLKAQVEFAEAQLREMAERKSANDAIERVSGNFSRASSASRTQGPGSHPTEAPDPSPEEGLRDV